MKLSKKGNGILLRLAIRTTAKNVIKRLENEALEESSTNKREGNIQL